MYPQFLLDYLDDHLQQAFETPLSDESSEVASRAASSTYGSDVVANTPQAGSAKQKRKIAVGSNFPVGSLPQKRLRLTSLIATRMR
jgi:hypothetical protein